MKRITATMIAIALITLSAIAQQNTPVTITVCDTAGVAIRNALIKLKPASGAKLPKELRRGVTTDTNGTTTLTIGLGDRLSVSNRKFASKEIIIGMTDTPTDNKLTVKLTPITDESIEVGFGTQKKSVTTNAVTQRNESDLQGDKQMDMYTYLQRALPGVTINRIGSSYSFQIRGMGSLSGNDSALVLIDGSQGDIGTLSPQDIKSITVLKDAASTAIYGGRAAFGAIIVKTKQANSK